MDELVVKCEIRKQIVTLCAQSDELITSLDVADDKVMEFLR